MTGATYIYLAATGVFLLWSIVLAILLIRSLRKNKALDRQNTRMQYDLEDMKSHVESVDRERASRRRRSATNTDYLIEEEEYV